MVCNSPKEMMLEIKRYMNLHDIPIKELALKMGTSQQNASKIFSDCNPKLETVFKILDSLDVNIDISIIQK